MVVCGGGILTPAGAEVPEEVVMAGSEDCDDSMGASSDISSITTSPTTMLGGESFGYGAVEAAYSGCSTEEDDLMMVDVDNHSHYLPQKIFCSTPMLSAYPSPVSSASPSPDSPSSAADHVSMATVLSSDESSSLSLEPLSAGEASFSPLLPNLGPFSLPPNSDGSSSSSALSASFPAAPAPALPSCPSSHHHHVPDDAALSTGPNNDPQRMQVLPLPLHQDLHTAILEAVALEPKYQPSLTLSMVPTNMHEISGRMRNGSCHVLRCLKVWYDLPCDTFFLAVNTMDRFLTRMRAQPKHLSCIAVSAFHVACEEMAETSGVAAPSRDSVSVISQSKCTSGDVQRMEDIIRNKLELGPAPCVAGGEGAHRNGPGGQRDLPVTPLTLLKLLYAGHCQLLAQHFPTQRPDVPLLLPLAHKLEVVVCDTRAANCRASSLALTLLRRELLTPSSGPVPDEATVAAHTACLQPLMTLCKVNATVISRCEQVMEFVLNTYDSPVKPSTALYHRQRLVWKLSNRTLRQLRPTDKLRRHHRLEPITEFVCPLFNRFQDGLTRWPELPCNHREAITFEEDDDHDYSKEHYDFGQLPAVAAGWYGDEGAHFSEDSDEEGAQVTQDETSEAMESGGGCGEVQQKIECGHEETALVADPGAGGEESMDTEEEGGLQHVSSDGELQEQQQFASDENTSSEVVMEEASADLQAVEIPTLTKTSVHVPHQDSATSAATSTAASASSLDCISSEKEESYSQVAKKMKEDVASGRSPKVSDAARRALSILPPAPHVSPYNATSTLQISPLSKITVTPAPPSSAVRRNLSSLLTAQSSDEDGDTAGITATSSLYSYHHRRVFGIVNLEHPEGGVVEEDQLSLAGAGSAHYPTAAKNAKRKKQLLKLQLVAQFRLDTSSDSEMPSEHASSSSEEEMDSDYEKEFPPLPLPRSPPHRRLTTSSSSATTSAALFRTSPPSAASIIINKKNKKKSDVPSPYAAKTKAMRKMHAARPMVVAQ